MAVTTVQRERLERRFDMWDTDHDGQLERSDFETEAKAILRGLGEPENTPRAKAMLAAYLSMWDGIAQDAGISPTGSLDKQTYVSTTERSVFDRGDKGFAEVVRPCIRAIVDVLDTDGDNEVSYDEWNKWAQAIGLSGDDSRRAFESIDANGSGKLTVDELVRAVHDYHFGSSDLNLLG